jgi:hypothetical protein
VSPNTASGEEPRLVRNGVIWFVRATNTALSKRGWVKLELNQLEERFQILR